MIKEIKGRAVQKHDLEVNWIKAGQATNPFVPMQGEIIVYDIEIDTNGIILELPQGRTIPYTYERFKIGDGKTNIIQLPFSDEHIVLESTQILHNDIILANILEQYIYNIDYNTMLAFDTSEIVVGNVISSTTSALGQAILGQMILA